MRHPGRSILSALVVTTTFGLACRAGAVQPAVFANLGTLAAPGAPASARNDVNIPLLASGPDLAVRWYRFNLSTPLSGDLFADIDTTIFTLAGEPGDLFLALYDARGNLVATDDADGSNPAGLAAALSFGSRPARQPNLAGQDGSLGPGVYWLALAAGNAGTVNAGATNWNLSTTRSYPLGAQPGGYLVSLSFVLGNTLPITGPTNDACANALAIGEDTASGAPAWIGSSVGATSDGYGACYNVGFPEPRDVWFSYTPSATGFAEAFARSLSGELTTPIIARYAGGCGSDAAGCAGSSSPATLFEDARIVFPVTQGQPVLLSLAAFGGQTGELSLNIRLVEAPCVADFSGDGTLDPDDLADYIACYFDAAGCVRADFNGDGGADPDDLADFIAAYFAGC